MAVHKQLFVVAFLLISAFLGVWGFVFQPPVEGWYRSDCATILDGESKGYIHLESNVVWMVNIKKALGIVYGETVGTYQVQDCGTVLVSMDRNSPIVATPSWLRMRWDSAAYTNGQMDSVTWRVPNPFPKGIPLTRHMGERGMSLEGKMENKDVDGL